MPKPKSPEYIKYLPLVLVAFASAGGWFTLKNSNAAQDKQITKLESEVEEQDEQSSEILVNQAKQSATLEAIYESVKELKASKK